MGGGGGGIGKGKLYFFPFEVGKMPGRPFRTKKSVSTNLSSIEGRGRLRELKKKGANFKFLALKVVTVAYEKC